MRFVISEEEKSRIRSLYESTPPDEYEVVGYINPFKETKYLPYAKVKYSKDLKDGDLFYDLKDIIYWGFDDKTRKCLLDFNKKIQPDFSDLIGKTIRTKNDEIAKIKNVYITVSEESGIRGKVDLLPLEKLENPEDNLNVDYHITFENVGGYSENLSNLIKSKLPIIKAKDLPDCLFELKKVKRVKTDFQP